MSTDYYIVCKDCSTDYNNVFWGQADRLTTEEDAQSILDNFQVMADLCQAAKAVDKSPLCVDLRVELNYIEFDDRNFFIEHRDHNLVVLSEYDVDWAGVHDNDDRISPERVEHIVAQVEKLPEEDQLLIVRFTRWLRTIR